MDVPLVDLAAQHESVAREVNEGFERVMKTGSFILGEDVDRFEAEFARFSGVRHCVGVANGTDALELSLRAMNIGAGDDVIVPALTFAATALAVVRAGARPILADVHLETGLIDVNDAARRVTHSTKAIMPVHLYGQMAEMERLHGMASAHGLVILEDAAQAHGASRLGDLVGVVGAIAATSFYPAKNLGAYGDAGAVLTNSDDLAAAVRTLGSYGAEEKYVHTQRGFNSRLDTLQAVVLRAKLPHLAEWNDLRRAAAERYASLLAHEERVTLPVTLDGNKHVWHLFVVRVADRDRVLGILREQGVGAGVHYPIPIHLQPAFSSLGHKAGDFPRAEQLAAEVLSLPMFPEINEEQQSYVAESLAAAL